MNRLSSSEKANLRAMAFHPEKQGVAITHHQLRALLLAQDERDELVDRMVEIEEVAEDSDGHLTWCCCGDIVAPGWR